MATQSSILIPRGNGVTGTLAGTTASGTITLNKYAKFAINATEPITIVFYISTIGTAPMPSGTVGFYIPAGVTFTFDLGSALDSFAIYNTNSSSATYSYQTFQTIS